MIIRGALQVTASRLLQKLMHERAGDSEIYRGIRGLADARKTAEIERARRKLEVRPSLPKSRKPKG